MIGSCNEYGFEKPWLVTQEIGKREEFKALTQVLRQLLDEEG
jgi:hypothetical protein